MIEQDESPEWDAAISGAIGKLFVGPDIVGRTIKAVHHLNSSWVRDGALAYDQSVLVFEDGSWTMLVASSASSAIGGAIVAARLPHLLHKADKLVEIGVVSREDMDAALEEDARVRAAETERWDRERYAELHNRFGQ